MRRWVCAQGERRALTTAPPNPAVVTQLDRSQNRVAEAGTATDRQGVSRLTSRWNSG